MESSSSWQKNLQIALLLLLLAASIRLYLFFRKLHSPAVNPRPPVSSLTDDDYVVPTKLHAFDLKSLRQGVRGKTVWVQAGNQIRCFPYDANARRVIFNKNGRLLPPLAALQIHDVVLAAPQSGSEQLMLVFTEAGTKGTFAVSAGSAKNGESGIYFDNAFFIEDPHQLYKHWPPEIWSAVDQHEAREGMNELQVAFALGAGHSTGDGGNIGNRTLEYENEVKSVRVTFENNRATEIRPVTN